MQDPTALTELDPFLAAAPQPRLLPELAPADPTRIRTLTRPDALAACRRAFDVDDSDINAIHERCRAVAQQPGSESPAPRGNPGSTGRVWTFDQLLDTDFPPIQWAIPNVLPEGLTILAGRPKIGKSWLALQTAQAVATSGKVFGSYVERGSVLFVALEDSLRRIKDRMIKQGWPRRSSVQIITCLDALGEGGLVALEAEVRRTEFRLVVVDTLSRALAGCIDQNDEQSVTPILAELQRLSHDRKTTILVIDHHKKGRADDPVDDVMGSTGKTAVADGLIGLYRNRGDRTATLKLTGRDIDEQEMALQFDQMTCCWQLVTDQHGVKPNTQQSKIIEAIKDLDGEGTLTQIANYLDKDKGNLSKELTELVSKGVLTRVATEGREKPYRLTENNFDN